LKGCDFKKRYGKATLDFLIMVAASYLLLNMVASLLLTGEKNMQKKLKAFKN